MKRFAFFILAAGAFIALISLWLNTYLAPGDPSYILSCINIGIGILMICVSALYLWTHQNQ